MRRACTIAILCLTSTPLFAQQACKPTEKLADCWDRNEKLARKSVVADKRDLQSAQADFDQIHHNTIDRLQQRLLSEPIGTAVGVAQTATQNLLPAVALAGLGIGKGADSNALRGDWNLPIGTGDVKNTQLRLKDTPKPELAQPVVDALAGAASSIVEDLRKQLGPEDDLGLQISVSLLQNHRFGRDLALHRDELADLLASAFPESVSAEEWLADFGQLCGADANGNLPNDLFSLSSQDAQALFAFKQHPKDCQALLDRLPAMAWSQVDRLSALDRNVSAAQLDHFADLVNNQPQLLFSAFGTRRDPLVGASFYGARLSFEMGWIDLNDFERAAPAACIPTKAASSSGDAATASASVDCAGAFSSFINDHQTALNSQDRIAAWIEYARLRDLHVEVPQANLDLKIAGASRIAAGISLGHTLWDGHGSGSTRIDGSARYERFTSDPLRLDHGTYSLVLTQRVGGVNVPLVLAYSDRAEFRGGSKPGGATVTLGLGTDFGLPDAPAPTPVDLDARPHKVPVIRQ